MSALVDLVDACIGLDKIELELIENEEIAAAVERRAEEARAWWVDYWNSFDHPFAREHTLRSGYVERPGDYANSIKVKTMRSPEGLPMARVTAHDFKSRWIEYGSSRMPEFACRAATVSHFGGTNRTIEA